MIIIIIIATDVVQFLSSRLCSHGDFAGFLDHWTLGRGATIFFRKASNHCLLIEIYLWLSDQFHVTDRLTRNLKKIYFSCHYNGHGVLFPFFFFIHVLHLKKLWEKNQKVIFLQWRVQGQRRQKIYSKAFSSLVQERRKVNINGRRTLRNFQGLKILEG